MFVVNVVSRAEAPYAAACAMLKEVRLPGPFSPLKRFLKLSQPLERIGFRILHFSNLDCSKFFFWDFVDYPIQIFGSSFPCGHFPKEGSVAEPLFPWSESILILSLSEISPKTDLNPPHGESRAALVHDSGLQSCRG